MFPSEIKYCRQCEQECEHVHVRNLDIYYWRCNMCLEKAHQKGKIFIPPYIRTRPRWIRFEELGLLQQFRMFQTKDSRF